MLSGDVSALAATTNFSDGTITPLTSFSVSEITGEKPQSKLWTYAGHWWNVMPDSGGTWIWRLDGTTWNHVLQISTSTNVKADVLSQDNVTHILLCDGSLTQLASVEYVSDGSGSYRRWSQRPGLVNAPLATSDETATLAIDSTGRMWIASDVSTTIEVRYSDAPYLSFSSPITIGSGITTDDISSIITMPNGSVGVLWSNQNLERFQFRTHQDGSDATIWSATESAAEQSALNLGAGMADDHVHLAVATDGTLYAAIKTGYDTSGIPRIGLLVRRPSGTWDPLYNVDTSGTRPIVVLDEAINRLMVMYTTTEAGGNIVFRETPLNNISFSASRTLISGTVNNVTCTKQSVTNEVLVMASTSSRAYSSLLSLPVDPPPPTEQAPQVNAGADQTVVFPSEANLTGVVTDDGLPSASLTTIWTMTNGSGTVTFGNPNAATTTATFSQTGTYVLRLTASDGQLTSFDELTVTVNPEGVSNPNTVSFQDGAGYSGTRDTMLQKLYSNSNRGSNTTIRADGSPDESVLIKWDLSSIPAGSTIGAGSLTLYVTNASAATYELYELTRNWSESSATWNQYASSSKWATAGAQGTADRGRTVLGVLHAVTTGLATVDLNSAGIAVLQKWVDTPSTNFGFAIQDYNPSDGIAFASSESSTVSRRPALTVSYTSSFAAAPALGQTAPALAAEATSSGLIGHWTLDTITSGVVSDSSGQGNNGVIVGDPIATTGRINTALQFSGNGDRIVVSDRAELDFSNQLTIAAWISPTSRQAQVVAKKARINTVDGFELSLSSAGSVFARFNQMSSADAFRVDSLATYPTDGTTWMHVAATYDGTTIKLYVNGSLQSSRSAVFQIGPNNASLGLGAQDDGMSPFSGRLDDVFLFNKALSAAEIATLAVN